MKPTHSFQSNAQARRHEMRRAERLEKLTRGTVSHATMRPQDLVPAFRDRILRICELDETVMVNLGLPELLDAFDDDDPYWTSEDVMWDLEHLMETLNELAPDGYVFSAHPGDGSDYGFWPDELMN